MKIRMDAEAAKCIVCALVLLRDRQKLMRKTVEGCGSEMLLAWFSEPLDDLGLVEGALIHLLKNSGMDGNDFKALVGNVMGGVCND